MTIVRTGVPAGNIFPVGTTTITYTATDAAGNVATGTQTVTVTQTVPAISVAATDPNASEYLRDPIVFTITRSGSVTGSIVINLGWSGTAAFGTDYTVTAVGGTLAANGSTITLPTGSAGATITVTPTDDTTVESVENVALTVKTGTGYVLGSPTVANGSITDNDGPSTVSVAATDASGAEAGSDPVVLTVTRGGNIWSTIVVNLAWSGTATWATDYTASAIGGTLAQNGLTLTLAPGSTSAVVTLTPVDDAAIEPSETATLTLKTGTGYSLVTPSAATGSIVDNDVAAVVTVAATDAAGAEQGLDPIVFTINRTDNLASQLVINLGWTGTAAYGTDHTVTVAGGTLAANGSTLTLPAGTASAMITVQPVDDAVVESPETVIVTVKTGTGYTVGSPGSATGSITDNDIRTVSVADATVTEADKSVNVNVVVTLSSASTTSVTVVVTTVAGTALAGGDFTAKTATLTFNPGVTSMNFTVAIVGDKIAEPTEAFTVVLSNPNGATIGDGSGTVTIADNDSGLVVAEASSATVGEVLSRAAAASVLADAKMTWAGTLLDAGVLDRVTVTIVDLPGRTLGEGDGALVRLDADAAGWGWSLDGSSPGIDLRAVLAHELGHALGLSHDAAEAFPVMAEVLPVSLTIELPAATVIPATPIHPAVIVLVPSLRNVGGFASSAAGGFAPSAAGGFAPSAAGPQGGHEQAASWTTGPAGSAGTAVSSEVRTDGALVASTGYGLALLVLGLAAWMLTLPRRGTPLVRPRSSLRQTA